MALASASFSTLPRLPIPLALFTQFLLPGTPSPQPQRFANQTLLAQLKWSNSSLQETRHEPLLEFWEHRCQDGPELYTSENLTLPHHPASTRPGEQMGKSLGKEKSRKGLGLPATIIRDRFVGGKDSTTWTFPGMAGFTEATLQNSQVSPAHTNIPTCLQQPAAPANLTCIHMEMCKGNHVSAPAVFRDVCRALSPQCPWEEHPLPCGMLELPPNQRSHRVPSEGRQEAAWPGAA